MTDGCAARVRTWWLELIAGESGLPVELVHKIRLLEGTLPFAARLLGLRGVRTIADLLPDDDAQMGALLAVVHEWTGQMLAGDGADSSD